ncbi:signal peptidase II [Nocardiopsis sp. CC223A]|uniref:signal peptidase II n=1 Tax=Nocardiopsis sp. CC223A TaxID=3044051 RepID=UPI00278C4E24|nr:signal peptidase II [Nocardiopsis sp. CC223A]
MTTARTGARPRRYLLLVLVALAAVGADLLTKEWVLATFREGERLDVIGEIVQFTLVYNTGAAFSMGTDHTWVFSTIAIVVVCAIAYLGLRVRSVWWAVTLGLMMGGAAGNLVDRIFRGAEPMHGAVVDFIKVMSFPVFNIADSCVVVGACLVVLLTFKGVELDGSVVSDDKASDPDERAAEAGEPATEDTGTQDTAAEDAPESGSGDRPDDDTTTEGKGQ